MSEDYIHIDNCVDVVLDNGWLSYKQIFEYLKNNINENTIIKSELTDMKYLFKIKELMNTIEWDKLTQKIIALEL